MIMRYVSLQTVIHYRDFWNCQKKKHAEILTEKRQPKSVSENYAQAGKGIFP